MRPVTLLVLALSLGVPSLEGARSHSSAKHEKLSSAIEGLREKSCTPISFLHLAEESIPLSLEGSTADEVLQEINARSAQYKFESIYGRPVVYPKDSYFQRRVEGMPEGRLPRIEAAGQLAKLLRKQVPELSELVQPPIVGDPEARAFMDLIELPARPKVIEALVLLLGSDQDLYLELTRAPTGKLYFFFGQVSCER